MAAYKSDIFHHKTYHLFIQQTLTEHLRYYIPARAMPHGSQIHDCGPQTCLQIAKDDVVHHGPL